MKVTIETTADGSPTLYRSDLDEHYHSVKGALAEALHVYVDSAWRHASAGKGECVRVFEVGFGTGLNAALTAQAALQSAIPTRYYSVELFPLSTDETALYGEALPPQLSDTFQAVNAAPWNKSSQINRCFTLTKLQDDLLSMQVPAELDVVYFDAFAPEKQPEMWQEAVFRKIFDAMTPGATLTTYCAKGAIRRLLADIGFVTERLPGPPAGKREILRATRPRL